MSRVTPQRLAKLGQRIRDPRATLTVTYEQLGEPDPVTGVAEVEGVVVRTVERGVGGVLLRDELTGDTHLIDEAVAAAQEAMKQAATPVASPSSAKVRRRRKGALAGAEATEAGAEAEPAPPAPPAAEERRLSREERRRARAEQRVMGSGPLRVVAVVGQNVITTTRTRE